MPWTDDDMAHKGAKHPREAARRANAMLRKGEGEGKAIRVSLAWSNKKKAMAAKMRAHMKKRT